ncbi:hypothetical protein ABEW34_30380 [Paenibacillus algorifonticola]|uniref:hypothetical protein n=1 Tax=Paenibacillus algorifonticola TaxID=684063 RepID=UPI003D27944B
MFAVFFTLGRVLLVYGADHGANLSFFGYYILEAKGLLLTCVSSSGDINNITFKMPLPMVSVTRKLDQVLKKNMQLVLRSEAALKVLGDMEDQKSGPSETIL